MTLRDCKIGPAAAVSDMERAREFYEEKLGFVVGSTANADMVTYELGAGTTLALYVSDYAGTNEATLAGFEVSDFDAVFDDLKGRGVQFEQYDDESGVTTDEDGIIESNGYRVAFFRDPDGNTYSING